MHNLKKILVLTPGALGSTFFQKSLTTFLNFNNISTKNYHDLANFFTSLPTLINTLSNSKISVIGRCSPLRSKDFKEDEETYYKFCNYFFTDIIVISRCSFESALSYCASYYFDNIYSKNMYNEAHYRGTYTVSDDLFVSALEHFIEFEVWIDKYFPNHTTISYNDLFKYTDDTFSKYFNIDYDTDLCLSSYNIFNFLRVRGLSIDNYSAKELQDIIKTTDYLTFLAEKDLLYDMSSLPVKKITLNEKINTIINFNELLDRYNNYPSNHFRKVDKKELIIRAQEEDAFWLK